MDGSVARLNFFTLVPETNAGLAMSDVTYTDSFDPKDASLVNFWSYFVMVLVLIILE
jgi:hypothetical protein